ncbi:hypothetical protein MCHIJ_37610 [Mycolicibacterium chitae]|uniref:3-methyladenine DNA glycosylase n=1 Tax=Mycolicibacterium chitae TaxID=1792 RepID=A0A448I6P4_MYCCI|nr:3-methyladenine DNA glycosylase [Mycolicibacterium chitae]MCV7108761.1 3-methyladenine DNA glycosylase [Mycolicibacterium chitae]BBZ04324.1 hypothetical protein MCHIJ_37610 [Mycolicibacterium chitae]VEG47962.1 Uncharacterised protein [Mycolicibacterium chitae]
MYQVLPERIWTERAEEHRVRVEDFLAAHSGDGGPHPVWDFLFTYYSLRPRQLLRWHPGYGAVLAGPRARGYLGRTGYVETTDGVTVSAQYRDGRLDTVGFIAELLSATAGRPAQHHCFGLHEWAMVYRSDEVRHAAVPLRLGQAGTDAVVESMPLRCSHYDAYRFFTASAAPRNAARLTRETQRDREQPGCVHTNMDLYKWSYKLMPLLDSALLLDCLDLAAAARALDMRASPYDLRAYGLAPIGIEDPAGRAEYVRLQAEISRRAAPLRAELIDRCRALLSPREVVAGAAGGNPGPASG